MQSLLIALQLAAHTAGHVVVQKQDVFGTALCHLVHRLKRALAVTAAEGVYVGRINVAIDQKNRYLLSSLDDTGILFRVAFHKERTQHHNGIHAAVAHGLQAACLILHIVAHAIDDGIIIKAAQLPLYITDPHGKIAAGIRVGGVHAQDAHSTHGIMAEPLCEGVWDISAFMDHIQHFFAGSGADLAASVDHSGYRGSRYICLSGNVVNVHLYAGSFTWICWYKNTIFTAAMSSCREPFLRPELPGVQRWSRAAAASEKHPLRRSFHARGVWEQ